MGYSLPKWSILKMLSYLDYFVFFAQNNSLGFAESFSACFWEKKWKITCPFCMGYRVTKMEHFQNALISRLFGVFARGFLHRTNLCFVESFSACFCEKKLTEQMEAHWILGPMSKWNLFWMKGDQQVIQKTFFPEKKIKGKQLDSDSLCAHDTVGFIQKIEPSIIQNREWTREWSDGVNWTYSSAKNEARWTALFITFLTFPWHV